VLAWIPNKEHRCSCSINSRTDLVESRNSGPDRECPEALTNHERMRLGKYSGRAQGRETLSSHQIKRSLKLAGTKPRRTGGTQTALKAEYQIYGEKERSGIEDLERVPQGIP